MNKEWQQGYHFLMLWIVDATIYSKIFSSRLLWCFFSARELLKCWSETWRWPYNTIGWCQRSLFATTTPVWVILMQWVIPVPGVKWACVWTYTDTVCVCVCTVRLLCVCSLLTTHWELKWSPRNYTINQIIMHMLLQHYHRAAVKCTLG